MKQRIRFTSLSVPALCGALLLSTVPSLRADTVIFTYGTRLECKVQGLTPNGWKVFLGNDEMRSLVLDPATVKTIIYDYDSRLAAIREEEQEKGEKLYMKYYELGLWCEEHGGYDIRMFDRALSCFLHVRGKEGIPPEVYLHLGRMFEKSRTKDLQQALQAYQTYLKLNPKSGEASAAIERIQKELAENPPVDPVEPATAKEGLEVRPWNLLRGENPGVVQCLQEAANKTRVLEIDYKPGGKDKVGAALLQAQNLEKKSGIVMDIYNPEKHTIDIAMAIVTGAKYEWYESKTIKVPPGKWSIGMRFDLTRNTLWKSKATNWVFRTKPEDLNRVRTMVLLVYNGRRTGKVYFDAIRFEDAR